MVRVILEAATGPIAGRKIDVRAGTILRIGRTAKSDYAIGEDAYLSGQHFAIECDGSRCRVRDLGSSNGTFVNGARISETWLSEGDSVAAGGSTFTVKFEAVPPPQLDLAQTMARTVPTAVYSPGFTPPGVGAPAAAPAPAPTAVWTGLATHQMKLLEVLFREGENLYAILDASRESRVPAFLDAAQERYAPLRPSAPDPRAIPYLAVITTSSRMLDVLLKDAWGQRWGCYFASRASFEEVFHHLSAYLVLTAANGNTFTFRFFDPRVLPVFLNGLTPLELTGFFGPVSRIITEGDDPGLVIEYQDSGRGLRQESLLLK